MIKSGYRKMNESVQLKDTNRVKFLYHSVFNQKSLDWVLKHGLTVDSDHWIYLSEKPVVNKAVVAVFKVKIPNNKLLYDWRMIWCDEDGNELDMDHEYDPTNPYFMYNADIPLKYLERIEVKR